MLSYGGSRSVSCEAPLPPQPAKTIMKKSTTPSLSVS